ncbi:hypothetical protein ACFW1M_40985 [Streptomyces inhibens]|uniref:hypothetical protein n=1 Tax=Streptomyces inhibens TaxID=2293571 RepID=UPI0036845C6A
MTEPDFLRTTRTFYDAMATDHADRFRDALAATFGRLPGRTALRAHLLREPDEGVETTQQACLMARKPAGISRP